MNLTIVGRVRWDMSHFFWAHLEVNKEYLRNYITLAPRLCKNVVTRLENFRFFHLTLQYDLIYSSHPTELYIYNIQDLAHFTEHPANCVDRWRHSAKH